MNRSAFPLVCDRQDAAKATRRWVLLAMHGLTRLRVAELGQSAGRKRAANSGSDTATVLPVWACRRLRPWRSRSIEFSQLSSSLNGARAHQTWANRESDSRPIGGCSRKLESGTANWRTTAVQGVCMDSPRRAVVGREPSVDSAAAIVLLFRLNSDCGPVGLAPWPHMNA
jgi:hypothetical protein